MEGDTNLFIKEGNISYFVTVTSHRFHVTIKKSQLLQWFWEVLFWTSLAMMVLGSLVSITSARGTAEIITFKSLGLNIPAGTVLFIGVLLLLLSVMMKIWYHDEEIEISSHGTETWHHFFKIFRPIRILKNDPIIELDIITTPTNCTVLAKSDANKQYLVTSFPEKYTLHIRSMIQRCWTTTRMTSKD